MPTPVKWDFLVHLSLSIDFHLTLSLVFKQCSNFTKTYAAQWWSVSWSFKHCVYCVGCIIILYARPAWGSFSSAGQLRCFWGTQINVAFQLSMIYWLTPLVRCLTKCSAVLMYFFHLRRPRIMSLETVNRLLCSRNVLENFKRSLANRCHFSV